MISIAIWSQTVAKVKTKIVALVRNLSGKSTINYEQRQIVSDAINEAMQDICLDRGVSRWRFLTSAVTADTTASTAYVDLTENVYNVVSGTVRIEAENVILLPASLEYIYQADPNRDYEGCPEYYAFDASDDAETMRLVFRPIPDAVYTVAFVAETIIDEDGISSFPAWMHGMLIDLATSIALRRLGLGDPDFYERKYKKRKQNAKASQGHDGPMYINRAGVIPYQDNLQSRCP